MKIVVLLKLKSDSCFFNIINRIWKRYEYKDILWSLEKNILMAGAERLELPTPGFGDRCSTNWTTPLLVWINWRNGRDSNPRPPAWQAGILTSWTTTPLNVVIGSALLSHGDTPHYHQRYNISLLSSVWYQVDLLHYLCQKFFIFLIYSMNKLKK